MFSLKALYKIGYGPSSSHTMGPANAARYVKDKFPFAKRIDVVLYSSLALTGKGHLTDYILDKELKDIPHEIIFDEKENVSHPNTMKFIVTMNNEIIELFIVSVGGGIIEIEGESNNLYCEVYPHKTFESISNYCISKGIGLNQYVDEFDDKDINNYLENIYNLMIKNVDNGLEKEGFLPGKLKVERKAKLIFNKVIDDKIQDKTKEKKLVCAYAFAASEENASGALVVTSPTCGACGIIPSLLKYFEPQYGKKKLIEGLKVAGLIGLIVKHNASISGAECGCQAEIGPACSMGAALCTYLFGGDIHQIGRASEIAMEHLLGLTCDPIDGYVQIPCIERNAVYALRAIEVASLALFIGPADNKISFDTVVKTMYETGLDLHRGYKETSKEGLAKHYKC